jgi:hypothetical protein
MVAYRLSGKNADRTRSCPAQPLQCLSAHPARLRLMHLHTPVYSIHTAACRIRILISLILLTRLAEGYPEFHCSLFAPMESMGGRGREGKVRALTEWSIELVDAAFALRGVSRRPLESRGRPFWASSKERLKWKAGPTRRPTLRLTSARLALTRVHQWVLVKAGVEGVSEK